MRRIAPPPIVKGVSLAAASVSVGSAYVPFAGRIASVRELLEILRRHEILRGLEVRISPLGHCLTQQDHTACIRWR